MYYLKCGQEHNNGSCDEDCCIVGIVPLCLRIVKRRQKSHAVYSRFLTYKIDLLLSMIKIKILPKWSKIPC